MKRIVLVPILFGLACASTRLVAPPLFPLTLAWTTPIDAPLLTPLATDGARVFVSAQGVGIRALDAGTGALVWRDEETEGRLTAAPDALYVREANGGVWRLDPLNGQPYWRVTTGVQGDVPAVISDGRLIVAGEGLAALDALSGRLLWTTPDAPVSKLPPGYGANRLFVVGQDATLYCRDAATGEVLWTHAFSNPLLAAPVLDEDGRLLVGTAERGFVALDVRDGRQRWRWKVGTDIDAPATVYEGNVLFASLENVLYAVKRNNGHLAWRRGLPTRTLGGPQLLSSAVIVATREQLLLGYDAENGRPLGNLGLAAEIAAPPVIIGDLLIAGLRDRTVVAVAMAKPPPEFILDP